MSSGRFSPNFDSLELNKKKNIGGQSLSPIAINTGEEKNIFAVSEQFVRTLELSLLFKGATKQRASLINVMSIKGALQDTGEYSVLGDEINFTVSVVKENDTIYVRVNNADENIEAQCLVKHIG